MTGARPSLKGQLVWRLVTLQAGILTLFVLLVVAALWRAGFTFDGSGEVHTADDMVDGFVIARSLLLTFGTVILPSLVPMIIATLVATPIVVRAALAGLGGVVDHAERIDVGQPGARLPVSGVPAEVGPLVAAVNDALGRLDEGYARQQRFLAAAAHELRTPIAILHTRIQSLPSSDEQTRLLEDVARLSTLADQLLDLQRLGHQIRPADRVDLVELGRRVAADLAPLAIAAGYELAFEGATAPVWVTGDRPSLERALMNLVQNAIEHGGRRGTITMRATADGTLEVVDEGAGIPAAERERVFEPFARLHPRDRGAGLGLHLVREVVRLHHGEVSVADAPGSGALFRIALPLLRAE